MKPHMIAGEICSLWDKVSDNNNCGCEGSLENIKMAREMMEGLQEQLGGVVDDYDMCGIKLVSDFSL